MTAGTFDLSIFPTIADLEAHAVHVQQEIKFRKAQEIENAKKQIAEIAQRVGLTVEEIMEEPKKRPYAHRAERVPVPIKYQSPLSPTDTWTGRGRTPRWLQTYEENGGDREKLRVPETGTGNAA